MEAGTEYAYQISALGDDFESRRSDTVFAEPGPTINWVADNPGSSNSLLKLSHDGRQIINNTSGFLTIIDIEPDAERGQVWVIDFITVVFGQVIRVSQSGEVLQPFVNFERPRDSALVLDTGELWVADSGDSIVAKLDRNASVLFEQAGFGQPISVSVEQQSGNCWVADAGSGQVVKLSPQGSTILKSSESFEALQWLAVNSADSTVWVVEEERIVKLDHNGEVLLQVAENFSQAKKVAVNENSGDIWVINWNPSTVSKFDSNGNRLAELTGFARPDDLSISFFDNSCMVADTENDRLVRIAADGSAIKVLQQLRFPTAVSIQNEQN